MDPVTLFFDVLYGVLATATKFWFLYFVAALISLFAGGLMRHPMLPAAMVALVCALIVLGTSYGTLHTERQILQVAAAVAVLGVGLLWLARKANRVTWPKL